MARVAAHLMTVGTYADICELIDLTDNAFLNAVMASAEPGWFTDRAWRYWTNYLTRRTDRPDRILAAASSAVRPAIGGF
ncbi:MAG TPA: hypothetical protein VFJ08_00385 [Salinisphaera sp.]|nr:hypothetical protein [Salinisphaera sp.]